MKVRDIMTSEGLATAALETSLTEIATRMRDENIGAVPIVDDEDRLAGIITDRDIVVRCIAAGQNPQDCSAEEILSEEMHTIHPDADIEDAADLMASRQIRRLPVIQDEVIVGMISLGDIAVKSDEEDASEALEDISEGVRETSGQGARSTPAAGRRQSPGEQVAEEETEYQRKSGRQAGGTRAESALQGRTRNASQGQQSIDNDLVDVEGEEEPEFSNAGGGQSRRRANQQTSARGRQSQSVRGRDSGELRESASRSQSKSRTQGASNRSASEENRRQQKVTEMRPEARAAARNRGKRKAG